MIPLLLLEDEPRVAGFIVRGLEAENYRVTLAASGPEALALGLAGGHELIVLDVMVPGIDGLKVCQELRAGGIAVPIIMLTARDTAQDEIEGLANGADDYLRKPFPFDVLIARLAALHRRRHVPLAAVGGPVPAVVGRLTIDLGAQEARVDGERVELTRRELDVLAILAAQPGRVVSRERILANAWGTAEDPLTNVVDVYIARLRRKLGDRVGIATVRGSGYKLTLE